MKKSTAFVVLSVSLVGGGALYLTACEGEDLSQEAIWQQPESQALLSDEEGFDDGCGTSWSDPTKPAGWETDRTAAATGPSPEAKGANLVCTEKTRYYAFAVNASGAGSGDLRYMHDDGDNSFSGQTLHNLNGPDSGDVEFEGYLSSAADKTLGSDSCDRGHLTVIAGKDTASGTDKLWERIRNINSATWSSWTDITVGNGTTNLSDNPHALLYHEKTGKYWLFVKEDGGDKFEVFKRSPHADTPSWTNVGEKTASTMVHQTSIYPTQVSAFAPDQDHADADYIFVVTQEDRVNQGGVKLYWWKFSTVSEAFTGSSQGTDFDDCGGMGGTAPNAGSASVWWQPNLANSTSTDMVVTKGNGDVRYINDCKASSGAFASGDDTNWAGVLGMSRKAQCGTGSTSSYALGAGVNTSSLDLEASHLQYTAACVFDAWDPEVPVSSANDYDTSVGSTVAVIKH